VNSYKKTLKYKYPDCWRWISLARRIPGQLTDNEANVLFQLARARTPFIDPVIVELGARRGETSLLLAAGLRAKTRPRLFSIQRDGDCGGRLDQQALHRNLRRCGLGHIVDTTAIHSRDASANWKNSIDILLINATEDYDALESDLLFWSAFVKLGGIVVLHGVSRELPEHLQSSNYSGPRHVDSLAWAVKQCAASIASPAPSIAAEVDSKARQQQIEGLFQDLGRVRHLLNRSIEAMLLNTIPASLEAQILYHDAGGDHLEDATEIAMARLQNYVRRTANELAESRHAIDALHRSWSWRLTAPLRASADVLYAVGGLLKSLAHPSLKAHLVGLAHWISYRKQVRASGLFDERYYRQHCPDVAWARTSPLLHFFVCGAHEGENPNPLFDVDYYLRCYPDVAHSGQNPLIHYLQSGAYEGRDPHPYFDSSFYLEENHDVRADRLNPLAHYLAPGIAEGRDPNPWFDTSEYLEHNPDIAMFGLNPLSHHIEERRHIEERHHTEERHHPCSR
jgi:predicted O-methyltransferase YrrM